MPRQKWQLVRDVNQSLKPDGSWRPNAPCSEVRAVYGGFGLAMAAVLTYTAVDAGSNRTGITLPVGIGLAGMAFGRLVSAVVDGRTPFHPNWFYFGVGAIAAASLLTTV